MEGQVPYFCTMLACKTVDLQKSTIWTFPDPFDALAGTYPYTNTLSLQCSLVTKMFTYTMSHFKNVLDSSVHSFPDRHKVNV